MSALMDFFLGISSHANQGEVSVSSDFGSSAIVKTDWIAATWYTAKVEYRPGEVLRARVWVRDAAEPDSWDVSTAGAGTPLSGFLELVPDNNSGGAYTLTFDNIALSGGTPVLIHGR